MLLRLYFLFLVTSFLRTEVESNQIQEPLATFDPRIHQVVLLSEKRRIKRTSVNSSGIDDGLENIAHQGNGERSIIGQNETARIYACHVTTDIRYRYARTQVTSRVVNRNPSMASEVTFQMVLPEAAFISKFLMEINGEVFVAHVKEKEEAKKVYEEAQNQGLGAGLVEVNARHANVFNVNLNVKPAANVVFNLTYEEFLIRKLGNYEQVIHIRPEQISGIPDYKISVQILESQNITKINVPKLGTNEILATESEVNQEAQIIQPSGNSAIVNWSPSPADKQVISTGDIGMKFIVQYDIQHDTGPGEILLMNGYFVHFFAPAHVLPLRKHVVYVLDTSGSMAGRRMEQLKHVMRTVLDDLKPDDYFNIVTFASQAKVVTPAQPASTAEPILASEFSLRKAHQLIDSLVAAGGTNIDAALKDALQITSRVKHTSGNETVGTLPANVESLVLFLTDGDPTIGVTRPDVIVANARERNLAKVPIYTISFGLEPDFAFLKNLALQNYGFARKIYEGGDADIQIRGFYKEISSPLLSNITFKYTTNSSDVSVKRLTKQQFPNIVAGSEIVVAGYLNRDKRKETTFLAVDIDANGRNGHVTLTGDNLVRNAYDLVSSQNTSFRSDQLEDQFLERLWAYITIKQLLEIHPNQTDTESDYVYEDFGEVLESDLPGQPTVGSDPTDVPDDELFDGELLMPVPVTSISTSNETARDRALRLALKYGFVTPITSLVVVKPTEVTSSNVTGLESGSSDIVNLEEAKMTSGDRDRSRLPTYRSGGTVSGRGRSRTISADPIATLQLPIASKSLVKIASPILAQPQASSGDSSALSKWMANVAMRGSMADLRSSGVQMNHNFLQLPSGRDFPSRYKATAANIFFDRSPPMTRMTTTTTMRPSRLTTISWPISKDLAGKSFLTAFGIKYYVLGDNESLPMSTSETSTCTGGTRHRRYQGTCRHLRDGILSRPEVKQNFELYVNSYFCEMPASTLIKYAGVCCNR